MLKQWNENDSSTQEIIRSIRSLKLNNDYGIPYNDKCDIILVIGQINL